MKNTIPFLIILFICAFARGQVIQSKNHSTLGYLKGNGTVQDRNHDTLGYIKEDGTVQDRNQATIGYAKGVSKEWSAVKFFFLND